MIAQNLDNSPRERRFLSPFIIPSTKKEAGYHDWKNDTTQQQIKIFLILSSIIILIFGLIDIFYLQEPLRKYYLCITFLGIVPFIFTTAIIYLLKKSYALCEFFIFLTMLAISLGSVFIVFLAQKYNIGQLYPILMIIILYCYFISSLQFTFSFIISAATLILYISVTIYQNRFHGSIPQDILFLSLCAFVSSIGGYNLEQSQRHKYLQSRDLQYLAIHDSLTGLYNRRYFFEAAEKRWNQCQRDNLPLTIMFADIDYFKNYNDHYGHLQGDICLKEISETFNSSLKRPFDIVARYGGEEFIFLWYNADFKYIQKEIDNIRYRVESISIRHEKSKINEYVTISSGAVFCCQVSENSLNTVVKKADDYLYEAKAAGRNRSIIHKL